MYSWKLAGVQMKTGSRLEVDWKQTGSRLGEYWKQTGRKPEEIGRKMVQKWL